MKNKYNVGDHVYCPDDARISGQVYIVDKYGIFIDNSQVYYDVMSQTLIKHVPESMLVKWRDASETDEKIELFKNCQVKEFENIRSENEFAFIMNGCKLLLNRDNAENLMSALQKSKYVLGELSPNWEEVLTQLNEYVW